MLAPLPERVDGGRLFPWMGSRGFDRPGDDLMGLQAYLGRIRLRSRWRSYAGIAVLLGLTAGLSLFAVAGARRTQSSYPRFLRSVNASTMSVSVGAFDPAVDATIAAFPEVEQSRTYVGMNTNVLVDGQPDFTQNSEAAGTFDGRYFEQDRFTATSGRRPDPTRPDEVAFNEFAAARFGYQVGQRLELGTWSIDQITDPAFFSTPPPPLLRTSATVVGIGLFPDEVLQDDGDRTARLLLTPAYSESARVGATFGLQGLVLDRGADDVDAVKERMAGLAPPGTSDIHVTAVDEFHALQAVRPLSIALGLFGAVVGLAGLVLVAQALSHLLAQERDERTMLRAFGLAPRALLRTAMVGPGVVILGGTALAVVLALAASPGMPIGPVRRVEPASGLDVDLTVMAVGALVVLAVLSAFTVVVAWRESPQRLAARRQAPARRARLVAAATAAGMTPSAVTGLRFALEPGDAARTTPTRSVMVGAAIAVAALVGSITFGASLGTLVREPHLFGWNWDAAVISGGGYDNIQLDQAASILDQDEHVAGWSGAYFGSDSIEGREVPLLGMAPGSVVLPPIVRGRPIRSPDEIVLGTATAAQIDKQIGDTVTLSGGGNPRQATVVGLATFPTIGLLHVSHTSLGVGALVAPEAVPGSDRGILGEKAAGLGPNVLFVRYRPGTDADAELAHLSTTTRPLAGFAGLEVLPAQRPAEIVNSSSIGNAPVLLAAALALGAMVSLGLALGSSVKRRGHDLTLLKTIGFTTRQLGATVSWHATTTVAVDLLVGVPVGIAAGRSLWYLFARRLDVVAQPNVPVLALVGIALAALLLGNAVATFPARAARRVEGSLRLTE